MKIKNIFKEKIKREKTHITYANIHVDNLCKNQQKLEHFVRPPNTVICTYKHTQTLNIDPRQQFMYSVKDTVVHENCSHLVQPQSLPPESVS